MGNKIKAVLFDLDGTLTDTEKYYQKAWPEALKHFGYKMTPEQPLELRSLGRPFVLEKFKEWYGEAFDYWKVRDYRKAKIEEMLRINGIPLKPGARETLAWLREHGVLIALVTANDRERAERYLKKIELFDYFNRIICADMVEKGKPAPDIYSYTCRKLKLAPEDTFAVEDSPNGCMSAYRAGCNVIMIPDLTEPDEALKSILYARLDCLLDICKMF